MKDQTKKFFTSILNVIPTFLTIIATLAIVWLLSTYYSLTSKMWFLPLMAGITALSAVLLPVICKRWKIFNSITAAGLTVFLLQVFPIYSNSTLILTITITIIGMLTEVIINKDLHIGDIIFDSIILGGTSFLINIFTSPVIKILTLILGYSLVLIIDFRFSFSFKQGKHAKANAVE